MIEHTRFIGASIITVLLLGYLQTSINLDKPYYLLLITLPYFVVLNYVPYRRLTWRIPAFLSFVLTAVLTFGYTQILEKHPYDAETKGAGLIASIIFAGIGLTFIWVVFGLFKTSRRQNG